MSTVAEIEALANSQLEEWQLKLIRKCNENDKLREELAVAKRSGSGSGSAVDSQETVAKLNAAEQRATAATAESARLVTKVTELEGQLAMLRTAGDPVKLQAELDTAARKLNDAEHRVREAEQKLTAAVQGSVSASAELTSFSIQKNAEVGELRSNLERLTSSHDSLKRQLEKDTEAFKARLTEMEKVCEADRRKAESADRKIKESEEKIRSDMLEQNQKRIDQLLSSMQSQQNRIEEERQKAAKMEHKLLEAQNEREALAQQMQSLIQSRQILDDQKWMQRAQSPQKGSSPFNGAAPAVPPMMRSSPRMTESMVTVHSSPSTPREYFAHTSPAGPKFGGAAQKQSPSRAPSPRPFPMFPHSVPATSSFASSPQFPRTRRPDSLPMSHSPTPNHHMHPTYTSYSYGASLPRAPGSTSPIRH